ncbi:glycoside hydrolase family 3 protein [Nocardia carnea]|uniref:beta-xylosidase/alpha-l-arabinosidase n=1 Tax=Nocardia carnea TaxID=37328 RepID=UPI002457FE35|nr:glycoside hydrolase family 3 N-terminal domain-containing protein [Nocardia carnea]
MTDHNKPGDYRSDDLSDRVNDLVDRMTLREKLSQLVGFWQTVGPPVAPGQDLLHTERAAFEDFARHGLGQITRPYGSRPVEPDEAREVLIARQRWLRENTRFGIPAIVHEECLTGLTAWKATMFPVPPAWGASFDPDLIEEMSRGIGNTMATLGIHQGLAPVLDVIRDQRWGRVEECISEDPHVVATIGAAYIRGLQSAGVIATLKHFVGYSNSRGGRNTAPVHAGPREMADVHLPPFEVAIKDACARSVMNSYAEIDGVPVTADPFYLTEILREDWGFTGTVVADYFSVVFLQAYHGVAAGLEDAAAQALAAGIDVELPQGVAYLDPVVRMIESGGLDEKLVDRALRRVLRQKAELGMLDDDYDPDPRRPIETDNRATQTIARRIAEESIVLLSNDGVLPLDPASSQHIAVIGPNADTTTALFGGYTFANHLLQKYPEVPLGVDAKTVLEAITSEFPCAVIDYAHGTGVNDDDRTGIAEAAALAADSDLTVLVLGDRAEMFGGGTSGEGSDSITLDLPGAQQELAGAVLAAGTPTIVVLMTGRGYQISQILDNASAVLQAFFPGQEGAGAIAGVLGGAVNPSGHLPMSLPGPGTVQPYSYLHPILGGKPAYSQISSVDPTPALPFGHGLSYTEFQYGQLKFTSNEVDTTQPIRCSIDLTNSGERTGADVVQLYVHDPVASVTRPLAQLVGYARVALEPGETATVGFDVPPRQFSFTGRDGRRIVEPGELRVSVRRSLTEVVQEVSVTVTGPAREVPGTERRLTDVEMVAAQSTSSG